MKFLLQFKLIFYISLLFCVGMCENSDLFDTSCHTNLDCEIFKESQVNVTCLNSNCVCTDLNGSFTTCIPNVEVSSALNNIIGGPCPCGQPNSECNSKKPDGGICFCKSGYTVTFDKRRCIKKKVHLSEICESNDQCMNNELNSVCDFHKGICVCEKGFVELNGGCISILGLNEPCINSEQCNNKTLNSICVDRKCACNEGFIRNRQKSKCLIYADYGEKCEITDQCKNILGTGSECYSGICTCDSKHALFTDPHSMENYCEKRIEFGDYCQEHNDCYQYHLTEHEQSMKCFFTECVCKSGFYHKDKHCYSNNSSRNFSSKILIIIALVIAVANSFGNHIKKDYEF